VPLFLKRQCDRTQVEYAKTEGVPEAAVDEAFEMDATKATLVKMVLLRKELVQLGDATSGGPGGGPPGPLGQTFPFLLTCHWIRMGSNGSCLSG
jgi:hypothetical protein